MELTSTDKRQTDIRHTDIAYGDHMDSHKTDRHAHITYRAHMDRHNKNRHTNTVYRATWTDTVQGRQATYISIEQTSKYTIQTGIQI